MKRILLVVLAGMIILSGSSCKSGKSGRSLCDSTCMNDTVKFFGDHPLKPYLYIIPGNCSADSIVWSYSGLGTNRKTSFDYNDVVLNKDFIRCLFRDTSYVYLLFNDCISKRGFQVKVPFSKTGSLSKRTSGINNIDPKFSVDNNLIAYTDRGNIYVEEPSTGKTAMMTFGEATDMDYDAIHETLDSVNVTPTRIWVKIKINNEWKELQKQIELK
jgi:hypothetical protein